MFEPANVQPPQQEPNQRRHTRNRSQKSKIQYYNNRNTGRKPRTGNRPTRRHENSKSSFGQGGEGGARVVVIPHPYQKKIEVPDSDKKQLSLCMAKSQTITKYKVIKF